MQRRRFLEAVAAVMLGGSVCSARSKDEPPENSSDESPEEPSTDRSEEDSAKEKLEEFAKPTEAASRDRTVVQRWRVGMIIRSEGAAFTNVKGTLAAPADWPDQQVKIVSRDLSPGVTLRYPTMENIGRQMIIHISRIRPNEEVKAIVTFEIKRHLPAPPKDVKRFSIPKLRQLERTVSIYLLPSPQIESNSARIKKLAKEIGADKETDWERVEAIYDWVREKIRFQDNRGEEVKGTAQTLEDGTGDCDEMSGLFIAICRAAGVPARMVRVPKHVFPEFYLCDETGRGTWFPCQASGTRAFGSMFDPRPILQKGDNVPYVDPQTKKKTNERFLRETLTGKPVGEGSGGLSPRIVYEPVKEPY